MLQLEDVEIKIRRHWKFFGKKPKKLKKSLKLRLTNLNDNIFLPEIA